MIIALGGQIGSGKDTVAKMIQWYFYEKSGKPAVLGKNMISFLNHGQTKDLEDYSCWYIKKFAYNLKKTISYFTGCSMSDLEDSIFKEFMCYNITTGIITEIRNIPLGDVIYTEVQETYDENSWITFRVLLQDFGMGLRSKTPMIHINGLFKDYKLKIIQKFDSLDNEIRNSVYPNWIISDLRLKNEFDSIKERSGIAIKLTRVKSQSKHITETQLNSFEYDFTINNDGTLEELYKKVCNILDNEL